jgi:hypothetical protein
MACRVVGRCLHTSTARSCAVTGWRLDESSGHGRADERFSVILADWISVHSDQIAGPDCERSLIMQSTCCPMRSSCSW